MKYKIPTSWMGRDGKADYERIMSGEYDKKEEPQKSFDKKPDTTDFIYVPSINLYVAKQRTHLNKTWKDCWTELQKENYKMLKINEFREFLKYLKSQNNPEYKNIFNEITEVRSPLRAEWLDANFKKRNKGLFKKDELYILTENETKEEKLDENTLMSDKTPGISLDDFVEGKNITSQGLPNKNISSGNLYYWHPRSDNNSVARFDAIDVRAYLSCCRYPSYSYSYLGVRPCKAGLA